MRRWLETEPSFTLTAQRLLVALVMLPHGAQKLFGWFGGYGLTGTLQFFDSLQIPLGVSLLIVLGETLGALALALGLFTRLCALSLSLIMGGALLLVHARHGFFMNWFGVQTGEGIEFGLLFLGLSLPLAVRGGGRFALDGWLSARLGLAGRRERSASTTLLGELRQDANVATRR